MTKLWPFWWNNNIKDLLKLEEKGLNLDFSQKKMKVLNTRPLPKTTIFFLFYGLTLEITLLIVKFEAKLKRNRSEFVLR